MYLGALGLENATQNLCSNACVSLGSPPTDEHNWRAKTPLVLSTLGVLGLVVLFLWQPLVELGSKIYSSGDIAQTFPLLRTELEPRRPANELLSDPVTEMEPWLEFNREELLQGRLPLINPYNGGGVPHLANAQSAVFSPFSWPRYLLPQAPAYLLSAALKLLVAGLFLLLFLRQLGLSSGASLLGAIGYAFCGHNLLLLSYPHVGASALLPAMLYFTERTLARHERGAGLDRLGLAGLALSYAVCALAGQPEPLFFGALISAAYIVFRVVMRLRQAAQPAQAWRSMRPLCLGLLSAMLVAMALSAIGLLPFLEYMQHSRLAEQRAGVQTPLPRALWALHAFPDLLGNPTLTYYLHPGVPPINYEAANSAYVGSLLLCLALFACASALRRAVQLFFVVVMLLWIVWAYNLWGLNEWVAKLPLMGIAPINRSQFVFALAASICAAYGIDHLSQLSGSARWRWALAWLLFAGLGAAWFFAGAEHLLERAQGFVARLPNRTNFPLEQIPTEAWAHVRSMSTSFWLGAMAVAALGWARTPRLRALGCVLVGAVVFVQCAWLLRSYNPLIPVAEHMPRTPQIEALAQAVNGEQLAIVGTEALPPSMNLPYKIPLIANYDGMWVGRYDALYRSKFSTESNWRTIQQAELRSLELFGARWVLTLPGWAPVETLLSNIPWNPRAFMALDPVGPDVDLIQTFTVPRGTLTGLRLWIDMSGPAPAGLYALRLRDANTFELLGEHALDANSLHKLPNGAAEVQFWFAPVARSTERVFRLRIECQNVGDGALLKPLARADMPDWQNQLLYDTERRWKRKSRLDPPPSLANAEAAHPALKHWKLYTKGQEQSGGLALELRLSTPQLVQTQRIGPYQLWQLPTAQRYRLVQHAIVASSRERARIELDHPDFDPNSMVVLESPARGHDGSLPGKAGVLDIVEEDARRVVLQARVDSPAWLVTSRAYIPGWRARVDGQEATVLCANEGFLALELGSGAHQVELEYDPWSVRWGTWSALLGLLVLARWLLLGFKPRD